MSLEFFDKALEFLRRNIGIFQGKILKRLAKKKQASSDSTKRRMRYSLDSLIDGCP